MEDALISCLMVTRPAPERLAGLRLTLQDFARQTHANRELVMVIDALSDAVAAPVLQVVAESGVPCVRTLVTGRAMTLGALRNLSWSLAEGEVLCPWDDDDRHHPTRLTSQLAALQGGGAPACYLQEFLHLFVAERRLYRVNFRPAPDPVAVNTPMFRRDLEMRYPEIGRWAQMEEDLALFRTIRDRAAFVALEEQLHLFVYVAHGRNMTGDDHQRQIVDLLGASQGWLRRREAALREGLEPFDFEGGPITVTGRNGDAFIL